MGDKDCSGGEGMVCGKGGMGWGGDGSGEGGRRECGSGEGVVNDWAWETDVDQCGYIAIRQ